MKRTKDGLGAEQPSERIVDLMIMSPWVNGADKPAPTIIPMKYKVKQV